MLEKDRIYSARRIAEEGLILNSKGKKDIFFVIKQIERGYLKTLPRFASKKNHSSYRVLGSQIEEYLKKYEGK